MTHSQPRTIITPDDAHTAWIEARQEFGEGDSKTRLLGQLYDAVDATHRADRERLYNRVEELKAAYDALADADTLDAAIAEPRYSNVRTAHIAYLKANAEYTGIPCDAMIVLLYGKEYVTQAPVPTPPVPVSAIAETAHETGALPKGRYHGVLTWFTKWDYGYISTGVTGERDLRVNRADLLGVRTTGRLNIEADTRVEFSRSLSGFTALKVVIADLPASRAAYDALIAKPVMALPPRRAIRKDVSGGSGLVMKAQQAEQDAARQQLKERGIGYWD